MARLLHARYRFGSTRSRPRATGTRSPWARSRRSSTSFCATTKSTARRSPRPNARKPRRTGSPPRSASARQSRRRARAAAADRSALARDRRRRRARARRYPATKARRCARRSSSFPILLDDSVPDGADESSNRELRRWGTPARFRFRAQAALGARRATGHSRFRTRRETLGQPIRGADAVQARVSRARSPRIFSIARDERGYLEIAPPLLVSRETMWSTGQLSKFADAMFEDPTAGSS